MRNISNRDLEMVAIEMDLYMRSQGGKPIANYHNKKRRIKDFVSILKRRKKVEDKYAPITLATIRND